jgi:MFS family permease
MPLLVAGFFALQLDRSNIANALTSTIAKDLGVANVDINAGNQLQIAGIIIAEIPANLLLQKIGTAPWITIQSICWGLVGMFQAFITNKSSYFATRFLLGVFEAGYIPGAMLTMSLFYKRKEIATRTAIFYFGNYFSAGTGSLIAAGILQLAGRYGLAGWQWLFIIDGSFTLVMSIFFILLLPSSPTHTLPICRLKALDIFTDRDREILSKRILIDDASKGHSFSEFSMKQFLSVLADLRLWGHFAINMLSLAPKGGLQLYSPTIIRSLGFDTTTANALASVSNYGVCILSFAISWFSDHSKLRGIFCIIACAYPMIFAGVQYGLPLGADKWTKYAIFTLLNSGNGISQSLNDAWLSSNSLNHRQRSIGLALAVMGSNLGGLSGQQLFQDSDAPRYMNGFAAVLSLYAASMLMIGVVMGWYYWANKKAARRGVTQEDNGLPGGKYEI